MPEASDPGVAAFRALARETGAWIVVGSVLLKEAGSDKIVNRCLTIDPAGGIVARYDKIHLFDVDLANGETYRESATVAGGDRAVLAPTPWGLLGLTICYDLRFPELYRGLMVAGATVVAVPSAFQAFTGRAHWEPLLRARAIEDQCYVVAAAQWGRWGAPEGGHRTFGNSMIVDPWGAVMARAEEEGDAVLLAELDPAEVRRIRTSLPALGHRRLGTVC